MRQIFFTLVLAWAAVPAHAQNDAYPLPPKEWGPPVMDQEPFVFLMLDRLEYQAKSGDDAWAWDAEAWWGGDKNRLWLKSEGEGEVGGPGEHADVQALYSRRISPYWHLQGGIREEVRPEPSQTTGVLAIKGLAPYWFEVDGSLFFGNGSPSGRFMAHYDQLLTQRWIAQPRVETNFSDNGFDDIELGLRVRYEIRRELAPYVGVTWRRQLGAAADIARAEGRDTTESAVVLGLRIWY